MNEKNIVINIGRQLGSGGREIGKMIADRLGIAYYDKEILEVAARESGMHPDIFHERDEKKGFLRAFFYSFVPFSGSAPDFYGNQINEETLFKIQSEAIRKIAATQSCIFIGRCADYVLRDMPRCVNIFISANRNDRIKTIMRTEQVDAHAAKRLMEHGDNARADYYNFYSSGAWGEANNYHLCINSSILGYEGTVEVICDFVRRRFEQR